MDRSSKTGTESLISDENFAQFLRHWDGLNQADDAPGADPSGYQLWRAPVHPYPGLRAFGVSETEIFFSRDHQVERLLDRLKEGNTIVVVGGSGSGKSSLVRAGLIPRLLQGGSIPGQPGRWYVIDMRAGEDPNTALIDAIDDKIISLFIKEASTDPSDRELCKSVAGVFGVAPEGEAAALRGKIRAKIIQSLFPVIPDQGLGSALLDTSALIQFVSETLDTLDSLAGPRPGPPNLLLLIDQFEEIFRPEVPRIGSRNLCMLIQKICERKPKCLFLAITLRSEEMHRCADAGLADILTDCADILGPLQSSKSLAEIIVEPARAVFRDWLWTKTQSKTIKSPQPFDREVIDFLIDETEFFLEGAAHKSDYLPLLQHGLLRLWATAVERWKVQRLPDADHHNLQIGLDDLKNAHLSDGLQKCLEYYADAALPSLSGSTSSHGELPTGARDARGTIEERGLFCTLARKDDRGNWARRFSSIDRVVKLLSPTEGEDIDTAAKRDATVRNIFDSFWQAGYLNYISHGNDQKLYDVSHEALIRNWRRYTIWLQDATKTEESFAIVLADFEDKKGDLDRLEELNRFSSVVSFFQDDLGAIAASVTPRRTRDDLAKVFDANTQIASGVVAMFLADREEGSGKSSENVSLGGADYSVKEIQIEQSIQKIKPIWMQALRYDGRKFSRLTYLVGGLLGIIVAGLLGFVFTTNLIYFYQHSSNLNKNAAGISEVASQAINGDQKPYEVEAYELSKASDEFYSEYKPNDLTANKDLAITLGILADAERQLADMMVFHIGDGRFVSMPGHSCVTYNTSALQNLYLYDVSSKYDFAIEIKPSGTFFPVTLDPNKSLVTNENEGLPIDPAPTNGSVICISPDINTLMVWNKAASVPSFWRLDWFNSGKDQWDASLKFLPALLPVSWIDAVTSSNSAPSSQQSTHQDPWVYGWQTGGDVTLSNQNTIFKSGSVYRYIDDSGRNGFAFKLNNKKWLVADRMPSALAPVVVEGPSPDDVQHAPDSEKKPSSYKFLLPSPAATGALLNLPGAYLEISTTRSDNTTVINGEIGPETRYGFKLFSVKYLGLTITSILTDGSALDIEDQAFVWRRYAIGPYYGQIVGMERPFSETPPASTFSKYLSPSCLETQWCWQTGN